MKYCSNCRQAMPAAAAFCKTCGRRSMSASGTEVQAKATKGRGGKIILFLLAVFFLLAGLRMPLTMLAGNQTIAVIESVKQDISSSSSKMDYNYDIGYTFVTDSGQRVNGSYRLGRVYNVAKLPREGALLDIKYLPGLSFINLPLNVKGMGTSAFILIGLGVLLFIFAIKVR